jgi:hypothetical protein
MFIATRNYLNSPYYPEFRSSGMGLPPIVPDNRASTVLNLHRVATTLVSS